MENVAKSENGRTIFSPSPQSTVGMFCTLIGIFPPEPKLWNIVKSKVSHVNGVPVQWSTSYSLVPDEDRLTEESGSGSGSSSGSSTITLITNVVCEDPLTPSDIVSEVRNILRDASTLEQVQVEQWASAPAPLPLSPVDGYSLCTNSAHLEHPGEEASSQTSSQPIKTTNITCAAADVKGTMQKWGIFRQNKVLTADQVSHLRKLVQSAIHETEGNLAKYRPEINVGKDNFFFKEVASRSYYRFDLRIDPKDGHDSEIGALVDEWVWNQPLVRDRILDMLGTTTPEDIHRNISIVYSKPGANHQGWHADGNHVPGQPDAGWDELGYQTRLAGAFAICLFVPLVDLNQEVGFTQFWPGSHRSRDLMGFGKVAELTRSTWDGICNAGDSVWYDYRLMHRGMPNRSENILRPVVQIIFAKRQHAESADYNFGTESIFDGGGQEEVVVASSCCS